MTRFLRTSHNWASFAQSATGRAAGVDPLLVPKALTRLVDAVTVQEGAASTPGSRDRAESRKKKKSFYAKLKRDEDDKMAELAAKYR